MRVECLCLCSQLELSTRVVSSLLQALTGSTFCHPLTIPLPPPPARWLPCIQQRLQESDGGQKEDAAVF